MSQGSEQPGATPYPFSGYKLLTNPSQPGVVVLQLETPAGAFMLAARQETVRDFAEALLRDLDAAGPAPTQNGPAQGFG